MRIASGVLVAFFVLVIGTGFAEAVTQSDCGTLSTANMLYQLNQSVNSTGTCFTITANNITLDCKGYVINYSQLSTGYGVNITTRNSTTVKNCNIVQGSDAVLSSHGIYANTGVEGSDIYNNTIMTGGESSYGVYLYSVAYENSIHGNTINASGVQAYGIELESMTYGNHIYDNTIETSGYVGHGIIVSSDTHDNNVHDNEISASRGHGIYLYSVSGTNYGSLLYSNNITTNSTDNFGIFLENSHNNTLWNNTVRANGTRVALKNTTFNTFENDTLVEGFTTQYFNIYSYDNSTNNNFTNLNFNKSDIRFGAGENNLTIKWFLAVNVTDSTGQLSFASVNINDSSNINYSAITNTAGIATFTVSETKLSSTGFNMSYNNYTITVRRTGYYTNSTTRNVTASMQASIFLTPYPTPVLGTQFYGYGRSVRMNLNFHIGTSKNDDEFRYNNTYVLANDSVVAGLIFSGSQDFGTVVNNSGAADYSLQLKQSAVNNKFYVVFTKGGWSDVQDKISSIDKEHLLSTTFGHFFKIIPDNFPLFIRLDYYDVDILNSTEITRGELVIKNEGKNGQGSWKISMVMR